MFKYKILQPKHHNSETHISTLEPIFSIRIARVTFAILNCSYNAVHYKNKMFLRIINKMLLQ